MKAINLTWKARNGEQVHQPCYLVEEEAEQDPVLNDLMKEGLVIFEDFEGVFSVAYEDIISIEEI